MYVSGASYNQSTGVITFNVTLYMNDFSVSFNAPSGAATVCIAKVGTTSCITNLTSYSYNSSNWLGLGASRSLGTLSVNVSDYSSGNYKIIAVPSVASYNKFSFSNNTYTNTTFFTVS